MFFDYQGDPNFEFNMYTPMHIVMVLIVMILLVLFFKYKDKIYNSSKEKQIRYGLAYFLIGLEIFYATIKFIDGGIYLPFHLCAISYYLVIILLFTKNEKVFFVLFFTGIIGGIVTFAIPELDHANINRFRFYQFIIAHTVIMIVPIYFLTNYKYKITKNRLLLTMLFVNIVGFSMLPVNILLDRTGIVPDANFMYTLGPPSDVEAVFGPYPWHLLSFEITLLITFSIAYFVASKYQNKKSNQ